ncbi:glycosyltransferase family 2 protein [bacterium]|nr:glycosyltransferase family 2 protein [bacterium]
METYIVLPAYNEGKVIKKLIESIKKEGYRNIIVVDDGSTDNTFSEAESTGVVAISHLINRGKGAATQTGIDAAKYLDADIIITMDSDGQHNPKDIVKLIKPLEKGECDVTIGSRFLEKSKNMPMSRVIMNRVGNYITAFFFHKLVTDSQSGFRGYSKKAANLVYTYEDRYEFESEMLGEISKHKLSVKEVPIEVIYTEYSLTKYNKQSSFSPQGLFNGIKMLIRFIEKALFK